MKPEVGHWDVLLETYAYLGPSHLITEVVDEEEQVVRTKCGIKGRAVGWSPDVQQCLQCLTAMRTDLNTVVHPREYLADVVDQYEMLWVLHAAQALAGGKGKGEEKK